MHKLTHAFSVCFGQVKATQTKPSLRQKVQEVQKIAEEELGFAPSETVNLKHNRQSAPFNSFLFAVKQRIVGLLVTEKISEAFLVGEHGQSIVSGTPKRACLGVHLLWVKASHRGQGIATNLVNVARERLVFGYTSIPPEQVAFSSPTESGLGFARAYMKRHNAPLLVYQFAHEEDCQE